MIRDIIVGEILEPLPERKTAVDADGWEYDILTGEVVGLAECDPQFEVKTEDDANWTLEVRSKIEGELAGLQARKRAVAEQLDALIDGKKRRLAWWDWRFETTLIKFARSMLSGKRRSWQGAWGKVSFRKVRGSHSIIDKPAAIEFMRQYNPSLIRIVESVTITDLLETVLIAEECLGEPPLLPFLVCSEEAENITVSTGIGVE